MNSNERGRTFTEIRSFEKPKEYNYGSEHYSDILFWDRIDIHEPPVTKGISDAQIKSYMNSDIIIQLPKIPGHSQATERHIQYLSECVTKVAGHENQEGYVKNRLIHHKQMGTFNSKKNYKCKGETKNS